jgi:hypothetical protein
MTMQSENHDDISGMNAGEMVQEIIRLRDALKESRATISRQSETIDSLRQQARSFYRAAVDYVPLPESQYDR